MMVDCDCGPLFPCTAADGPVQLTWGYKTVRMCFACPSESDASLKICGVPDYITMPGLCLPSCFAVVESVRRSTR